MPTPAQLLNPTNSQRFTSRPKNQEHIASASSSTAAATTPADVDGAAGSNNEHASRGGDLHTRSSRRMAIPIHGDDGDTGVQHGHATSTGPGDSDHASPGPGRDLHAGSSRRLATPFHGRDGVTGVLHRHKKTLLELKQGPLGHDVSRRRGAMLTPFYGGDEGVTGVLRRHTTTLPESPIGDQDPLSVGHTKKTLAIREQVSVSPGRDPGAKNRKFLRRRRPRKFISLVSLRLVLKSGGFEGIPDNEERYEEECEGMDRPLLAEAAVQQADAKPVYCARFLSEFICSLRQLKWKVVAGIHHMFLPNQFSWEAVLGSAIIQYTGGCSLSACSVCIEAQHRLTFERTHGAGSFSWRVEAPPATLRRECLKRNAWSEKGGGKSNQVLDVIIEIGGLPTTDGVTVLPIEDYHRFLQPYRSAIQMLLCLEECLSAREAARLLCLNGPVIGVLWATPKGYSSCNADIDDKRVYRGCPVGLVEKNTALLHAVVCYAYRFSETPLGPELHIKVLDSHNARGPSRWILLEAFLRFFLPVVRPVSLLPSPVVS